MSDAIQPASADTPPPARDVPRTLLLVAAAWAVPGLGHVLLGRIRRGAIFAALILGSFGLGLAHDGRLALRNPEHPVLTTLQVIGNIGVGPLDAVARIAVYGEPTYALPATPAHPRYQQRQQVLRERTKNGLSNFGTAYLWTAGLMNLLLLFDVWDIGRGRKA